MNVYFGKVYNYNGDKYRINSNASSLSDAEYIMANWDHTPPQILNWIYNKEMPTKRWDYYKWKANKGL